MEKIKELYVKYEEIIRRNGKKPGAEGENGGVG